jgi:hypothetical protein
VYKTFWQSRNLPIELLICPLPQGEGIYTEVVVSISIFRQRLQSLPTSVRRRGLRGQRHIQTFNPSGFLRNNSLLIKGRILLVWVHVRQTIPAMLLQYRPAVATRQTHSAVSDPGMTQVSVTVSSRISIWMEIILRQIPVSGLLHLAIQAHELPEIHSE